MADNKRNPFADIRSEKTSYGAGPKEFPSEDPKAEKSSRTLRPSKNSDATVGRGRIIGLVAAAALVIVVVAVFAFGQGQAYLQSTDTSSSSAQSAPSSGASKVLSPDDEGAITVSLFVDGTEGGYGVMYDSDITVAEDSSVYDVLIASGLSVGERSMFGMGRYIASINGLAERDQASTSGWLFSVNGERASRSSDAVIVHEGDAIEWVWQLDAVQPQGE